jgi:hypothetical protein
VPCAPGRVPSRACYSVSGHKHSTYTCCAGTGSWLRRCPLNVPLGLQRMLQPDLYIARSFHQLPHTLMLHTMSNTTPFDNSSSIASSICVDVIP